ncbi:MAG: hypothetical protein EOS11_04860 [Mesorhizobium sp.]|nr:MAG: hypothetical protein EOS11_04860 [Mesorhizobium sp.]
MGFSDRGANCKLLFGVSMFLPALSKTVVSEIGERLWADYQEFATRDLGEYEIAYLFVDGIAERIRPGQKREPVLAAWGFTASGAKVLLHLMAGSKEDAETVSTFFQDMRGRGLGDPLLVVCDGAAGIIKAIETCFPLGAPALPGAPECAISPPRCWRTAGPSSRLAPPPPVRLPRAPLPATSPRGWSGIMRSSCRARSPAPWTTSKRQSRI